MIVSKQSIRITPRWRYSSILLCVAAVIPLGLSLAQEPVAAASRLVLVYEDHYEYGARTFQTIGELTRVLEDESVAIQVMECGTQERIIRLMELLREREQANLSIRGVNNQDCI